MSEAEEPRSPEEIRREIEAEREHLASAVEQLRDELGVAANVTEKLRSKLPLLAAGAASAGFVLAGGVGATMRYVARRGREGHQKVRVGRWSVSERG